MSNQTGLFKHDMQVTFRQFLLATDVGIFNTNRWIAMDKHEPSS